VSSSIWIWDPFTGVVYLKSSGITEDFRSLKGKRIGYVGEFGKVHILQADAGVDVALDYCFGDVHAAADGCVVVGSHAVVPRTSAP
jgi:hypothetical protein